MNLEGIDLVNLSKLTSQQIDHITCLECCKHYIAPETAACGHTLCHNCWCGRKSCPLCCAPVERKQIKLNKPFQKLTEHIQVLGETFEKLFNIKLDEFLLDTGELEPENDPTKNVKDWLASSQNQFSAPAQSSELSSQELKQNLKPLEISSSKIQVHTASKKTISPEKIIHVSIPQDDWDKIETMPVTEVVTKNKENIIGPMDIEPFYVDDNEYSVKNPRRSSRKRELKNNDSNFNTNNNSMENDNTKDFSGETDKKSANTKQNWNNVKKMRKEFSKLNKIKRNKLNVSIEMCKKTQSTAKPNVLQSVNTPQVYDIDENTPKLTLNDLPDVEMVKVVSPKHSDNDKITLSTFDAAQDKSLISKSNVNNNEPYKNLNQSALDQTQLSTHSQVKETSLQTKEPENENKGKMLFYKKSALCTSNVVSQSDQVKDSVPIETISHNIESSSNTNDDIEISIKVGGTITNIVIKKKNDVQLKVNTDKEVQTSLCPQDVHPSPRNIETRNVSINIDSNNEVNIEHKQVPQELKKQVCTHISPDIKKQGSLMKSASAKKNTASAETGSGQFEITESVEKELSDIMEFAEIKEQEKTKSVPVMPEKVIQRGTTPKPQSNLEASQKKNTPKTQALASKNTQKMNILGSMNQEDLSYLNDLDIFESDTAKDTNVQLLKFAKNTTPSEILISTAHNKNKTQKGNEKRERGDANENLPNSKKQKLNDTRDMNKTADLSKQSRKNQPDSESPNYDSIMGHVFASIDADMEDIRSQNIASQRLGDKDKNVREKTQKSTQNIAKDTHKQDAMSVIDCTNDFNIFNNPKDSENIFSVCVEKEDAVEASAPIKVTVPDNEPQSNIDDFLTPVMSKNQVSSSVAMVESQVIELVNDDSESVVEDTPQKNTSFGKIKQKSGSSNQNSSQRINATESRVHSRKSSQSKKTKTVINLLDTSDMKIHNNVTVIDTARKTTLETPLTINKFVNHIQHNSTPVARKSLNFESENIDDPEQTLCPTSAVANTTQEKEFMRKAFEKTPTTQVVKPLKNFGVKGKRFCIAGSCLSFGEVARLKALCSMYKWSYVDKYTRDLTHLVVGVDEENKSQRSVKYMCSLAASKWIVSNEWVEKCLETKNVVGEEKYEALDSTGEPGPRRSRVANRKLFQGITFYCMEPFSVLDVDTLKEMLESSGGRVVTEVKEVRVTDNSTTPAILLAEPENTQEDRFIYLAMELSIVPVNYEWVLNCLGGYTLGSVQELLLCPSSLLPKATAKWPQELMAREDD